MVNEPDIQADQMFYGHLTKYPPSFRHTFILLMTIFNKISVIYMTFGHLSYYFFIPSGLIR